MRTLAPHSMWMLDMRITPSDEQRPSPSVGPQSRQIFMIHRILVCELFTLNHSFHEAFTMFLNDAG